jgi:hypothetical protein
MEFIPSEVLAHIFSYLRPNTLITTNIVCSAWHDCCVEFDLFREIKIVLTKVPHLKPVVRNDINIKELSLAVNKRYLILGGEDANDVAHIEQLLTEKGLEIEVWNPKYMEAIPTTEQLSKYGAVLIFNDCYVFQENTTEVGDLLAHYLEQGHGGVVQMLFTMNSTCTAGIPTGRYLAEKFCPLEYMEQKTVTKDKQDIGIVKQIPDHFLLVGVDRFIQPADASCVPATCIQDGIGELGSVVATFDNVYKTIAVACRELQGTNKGRVCALNFYPISSACPSEWAQENAWFKETNGAELMANALLYCAIKTNRK